MLSKQVLNSSEMEKELTELKQKLHLLQPMGETKLSPELSELTLDILSAWSDCEVTFENLICKKLFVTASKHRQGSFEEFKKLAMVLFSGASWLKKLEIVYELKIISDELYQELKALNGIRIIFAHTISGKYKLFNDIERQIHAYEIINKCLLELASEDSFFGF